VAGGLITTAMWFMRRTGATLAAFVMTMALALIASSWGRLAAEPLRSYAILARAIAARAPEATVICYHRYVQALPFYNRKRVILIGARTELGFGSRLAPEANNYFFKTDDDLLRLWRSAGVKVLVIDEDDLSRMSEQLAPYSVIGSEFHKRAIEKASEGGDN
jgi:hypothetical protein